MPESFVVNIAGTPAFHPRRLVGGLREPRRAVSAPRHQRPCARTGSAQWHVHCPPGTEHVFVGAGVGPCTILMVGGRAPEGEGLHYPANEVAAAHGASVAQDTSSPREAYAAWGRESTPGRMPWPPA